MSKRTCAVDECDRPTRTRGWCGKHYQRWRTWGSTSGDPAKTDPSQRGNAAATGTTKVCSGCGIEKDLDQFSKASTARLGRHSHCKLCRGAVRRQRYKDAPEAHRERSIWNAIKFRYGVTRDQFDEMKAEQGGVCAICQRAPEPAWRKYNETRGPQLVIDHCHATGKIRGLLCDRCNLGLGYFEDDLLIMAQAASYLRERG